MGLSIRLDFIHGMGAMRLVIFDLDGTLVDAYPAIISSFNHAMRALKLPPQKNLIIRRAVGWGDKNLLEPFVGRRLATRALSIYRKDHKISLKKKTRFLPGAQALIGELKRQGYLLALASNRPTKFSHIILEHLRIAEYFDYILCGDKVVKGKPHPEILRRILKKLSVRPQEAVYVGDMTIDVVAGKRAGIKTIAVATGSNTRKELSRLKPYRVIPRITQVTNILTQLNGRCSHCSCCP